MDSNNFKRQYFRRELIEKYCDQRSKCLEDPGIDLCCQQCSKLEKQIIESGKTIDFNHSGTNYSDVRFKI